MPTYTMKLEVSTFGLNLHLHPKFMYAISIGSGESSPFVQASPSLGCLTKWYVPKSHVLVHLCIGLPNFDNIFKFIRSTRVVPVNRGHLL